MMGHELIPVQWRNGVPVLEIVAPDGTPAFRFQWVLDAKGSRRHLALDEGPSSSTLASAGGTRWRRTVCGQPYAADEPWVHVASTRASQVFIGCSQCTAELTEYRQGTARPLDAS